MIATALVILPVFVLILAGALCRRRGVFGPATGAELNRFVVGLSLPALLFHITATADWSKLWQPRAMAAFFGASLLLFAGVLAWRRLGGRPLGDAGIDGLNAAYANTGYIGLPLCQLVFGPSSLPLATVATILTVCVLFAVAVVTVELGLQTEARPHRIAFRLVLSLVRNPLVFGPALGAAWAVLGVVLPNGVDAALTLLGAAASPCALVSLGLFLAERPERAGVLGNAAGAVPLTLTALKLFAQPGIAALLAYRVLGLEPQVAAMVVVLSALPTGTGAFMLAASYGRDAHVTSRTVLLTTVASVFTLTGWLWLVGARPG